MKRRNLWLTGVAMLVLAALLWIAVPRTASYVTEPLPEGVLTCKDWNIYTSDRGNYIGLTIPREWGEAPVVLYTSYAPEEVAPEDNWVIASSHTYTGIAAISGWSQYVYWDPGHGGTLIARKHQGLPEEQWYLETNDAFLTVQIMDGTDIIGYAVLQQFYRMVDTQASYADGTVETRTRALEHSVTVLEAVYFPEVGGQRQSVTQEYIDSRFEAVLTQARQQLT